VLSLPLFRRRSMATQPRVVVHSVIYFAGLGLGFLFIEIYLIEKATYFLNDRSLGFSLTLAAMLLFSGVGSYLSGRFAAEPARIREGLRLACLFILAFCAAAWLGADWVLSAAIALPQIVKVVLLLAAIAPLGIALGFPFAMGMSALRTQPQFMPWAWSLNGAFSVVASPLSNLLAISHGNRVLMACALVLYLLVWRWLPDTNAGATRAAA
jgi:MFS family permease